MRNFYLMINAIKWIDHQNFPRKRVPKFMDTFNGILLNFIVSSRNLMAKVKMGEKVLLRSYFIYGKMRMMGGGGWNIIKTKGGKSIGRMLTLTYIKINWTLFYCSRVLIFCFCNWKFILNLYMNCWNWLASHHFPL